MSTRIIILAGGIARRWNNYLGHDKHLIKIDGENLIERMVRLTRKYSRNNVEIFIVGENKGYHVSNVCFCPPENKSYHEEVAKYLSSRDIWNKNGRTIILLGDVWFSERAIKRILNFRKREFCFFGRKEHNYLTGHGHGELFAQSFYPEHISKHDNLLIELDALYKKGIAKGASGWNYYKLMMGLSITTLFLWTEKDKNFFKSRKGIVEIYDFTEDFDCSQDYDTWIKNRLLYLKLNYFRKLILKCGLIPFVLILLFNLKKALCELAFIRKFYLKNIKATRLMANLKYYLYGEEL